MLVRRPELIGVKAGLCGGSLQQSIGFSCSRGLRRVSLMLGDLRGGLVNDAGSFVLGARRACLGRIELLSCKRDSLSEGSIAGLGGSTERREFTVALIEFFVGASCRFGVELCLGVYRLDLLCYRGHGLLFQGGPKEASFPLVLDTEDSYRFTVLSLGLFFYLEPLH